MKEQGWLEEFGNAALSLSKGGFENYRVCVPLDILRIPARSAGTCYSICVPAYIFTLSVFHLPVVFRQYAHQLFSGQEYAAFYRTDGQVEVVRDFFVFVTLEIHVERDFVIVVEFVDGF